MIRKFYLFVMLTPVLASAQPITITVADMAQVGNVIQRKADTMTVITGPGPAGPNQSWVMTALSNFVINENTTVSLPSATPYAAQFAGSNLAMTNDNVNYIYLNQNSGSLTTQGGVGSLFGLTITAPLNPDLTLHQFPRIYGSNFTDTYKTDITFSGTSINPLVNQVRYKRVGTVIDNTDGWGTITTPNGTYDVLRVKREDRSIDTVWILPFIGFPPQWQVFSTKKDTSYSYQWLGNNMKLPVAELNYDSLDQPKSFKWTLLPPPVVGVNEAEAMSLSIFPNPASDHLLLRGIPGQIEGTFGLTDALGRTVRNVMVGAKNNRVSLSGLSPGLYFWSFDGGAFRQRGQVLIHP